jgi:uncharacterized protein YkwD
VTPPRLLLAATLASLAATGLTSLAAPVSAVAHAKVALSAKHHRSATHKRHSGKQARKKTRAAHTGRGGRRSTVPAPHVAAPRRTVPAKRRPVKPHTVALTVAPPKVAGSGGTAAIAAVLATPCENTELLPTVANLEQVRASVLCLINQKRAQSGEAPLKLNSELSQAAEGHSQELVSANYFAHVSPSGVTPVDRIRSTGYIPSPGVGYVIGENLAWGTYSLSTPQAIVAAWIASPGHLANILESKYTETGLGVDPQVPTSLGDGAPGATYAQEFGLIVY